MRTLAERQGIIPLFKSVLTLNISEVFAFSATLLSFTFALFISFMMFIPHKSKMPDLWTIRQNKSHFPN
jgi:hypothetical protein